MSYSLAPNIKSRFFITGTNKPLAGGLMYTYLVGTTTKAATYSDAAGTPNTNPIVLDSDGECNLYLDDAISYRIILENAAGVTQFDEDRIASINNAQIAAIAAGVASTAADRVQTGLDAVATAADRVQTGLDRVATIAARDAALLSSGLWPTTAAGIGNGVAGTSGLVAGSSGTNGTFALAFSGGTQVIAPVGYFVVTGGAVTQVVITYKGYYSAGTPTISFAASSGLTGASVTAVMATNTPINQYFTVPASTYSLILYKVTAGPVATEQARYATSTAVDNLKTFAGKYNGWPDPFFRRLDLTTKILHGRSRWWTNNNSSVFTGWSRVAGTAFNGYALRRAADQSTTPFNGPAIWLDEIGATTGDTVTIYGLFTGSGAVAQMPSRFDTGVDTSYVGGQINPTSLAGTSSVTTTSTPQWLRITATVLATAQRLVIYPYTSTAGQTFDLVACWAVKGAAVECPDWPTLNEEAYYRLRDADLSAAIVKNTEQDAELDYMMISTGVVTSASSSTNLAVTGAAIDTTFSNVFTGWGERYTPASISFNAVTIKKLGRNIANTTVKWRTLNIVVRTGTNSHLTGATVVAIGSITVNPDSDTLTDITILLKDPTTGTVKTLTNADFASNEYFIGVYARDAADVGAGMSFHAATQSNTIGQSYYITSSNPLTATWAANSGNERVGVDHLLLTTPVEDVGYEPTVALLDQISQKIIPTVAPTVLVLPPTIYGVQGRECNVYFDNLFVDDSSLYLHDVTNTAANGAQQRERWTWTPTGAQTTGTLSISACDKKTGAVLVSATTNQRSAASAAGSGTTKVINTIGDSLIYADTITQTVIDIASTDDMSVTMIGTRGTGANKHEGRGGWTINDFATVGRTFYSFTVSGVVTTPAINSTIYTNNGSTFKVQETAISAGSGTIICERTAGSNAPSASGTLTKSSGTGDATIAFSSSSAVSGNPFWISGALNYGQYLTNNSLATPDWVLIHLGINDAFSYTTDATVIAAAIAAFVNLDLLITSIKAAGAGVKVGLMIPTPPAGQDGFGANYGAGQTAWRNKRNIMLWAQELITKYTGQEASRIYLVPSNTALDTANGYPLSTSAPVNSRSSIMVQRQNNGVHPDTGGYQQIGDALWAFLKCNA